MIQPSLRTLSHLDLYPSRWAILVSSLRDPSKGRFHQPRADRLQPAKSRSRIEIWKWFYAAFL